MFGKGDNELKPYGARIDVDTRSGKIPIQLMGDGRHLYISTTKVGLPFHQRMTPASVLWSLGDGNVEFDSDEARSELMNDIASIQHADELEAERNAAIAKIATGVFAGVIIVVGASVIAVREISKRR